jgi:hypothetical protein
MKKTTVILIIMLSSHVALNAQTNYTVQYDGANDYGLKSSVQNLSNPG